MYKVIIWYHGFHKHTKMVKSLLAAQQLVEDMNYIYDNMVYKIIHIEGS